MTGRTVEYIKVLFTASILLAAVTASGEEKVACVGNSITYGYGLTDQNRRYTVTLEKLLGSSHKVGNFGINSATVSKRGNLPYWTTAKMKEVFAWQPDIVTIMLGTNDTKPQNWDALGYGTQFETDYAALIDTFVNMPSEPIVYAVLPVPVYKTSTADSWGIRDSALRKILPLISKVAEEKGVTVIDCNTPLLNCSRLFPDGVHPNAEGEDSLAHILHRALTPKVALHQSTTDRREHHHLKYQTADDFSMTGLSQKHHTSSELYDINGKRIFFDETGSVPHNLRSGVYLLREGTAGSDRCRKVNIIR